MRAVEPLVWSAVAPSAALTAASSASTVRRRESGLKATILDRFGENAGDIRVAFTGAKAISTGGVKERGAQALVESVARLGAGVKTVDTRRSALEAKRIGKGTTANEAEDVQPEHARTWAAPQEVGTAYAGTLELEVAAGSVGARRMSRGRMRREAKTGGVAGVQHVVDVVMVAL